LRSSLSALPAGAIEAYETLRLRVIQPDRGIVQAEGRGVLIRCGLARWAQVQSSATTLTSPSSHPDSCQAEIPAVVDPELVQLVAGLILSRRKEVIRV
jgi:hypothetical protein